VLFQQVTFGALGDSFYEYMLKLWLQGSKTDPRWREMYDRAMDGVANKLLQKSDPSGLAYVADWDGGRVRAVLTSIVSCCESLLPSSR
jgi:mannosyl-oligosaccharide alpha-1,2-mannosidase